MVAHRAKPLDLVAVPFAGNPETLHAAQRKTSVSDLPVERLPDHPARPLCTAKPPSQVLLQNRQIIHFAADPGSGHTVVSPAAPVAEFVPENPSVGMADQEIFVIAEQLVESGRKHHPVVSCNPVLAAQPFVRHLPNRQSGELTPDRRTIHTAGNQEFDRIIFLQHPDSLPQRRPFPDGQFRPVNRNDDHHFLLIHTLFFHPVHYTDRKPDIPTITFIPTFCNTKLQPGTCHKDR